MATKTGTTDPKYRFSKGMGTTLPFEDVSEPGAYISNWDGHLVRISDDCLKPGHSPVINFVGREELYVTKISNDPWVPVSKARQLASNFDMEVNF